VLTDSTYTLTLALPAIVVSAEIPEIAGEDVNDTVKAYVAVSVSTHAIVPASRITSSPNGEVATYTYLGGLL
jgi:GTP:adenosylcobinamide-phosphate guanylyltransferase